MNLEELVDSKGFQQDEWSLTRPTFGNNNHLTVVGWSGQRNRSDGRLGDKYYIVHCSQCAKDPELFGEGYFRTLKFSLFKKKPQIPCGCAKHFHWTEEQYKTLCRRKLNSQGLEFIGWDGEYKKHVTKVKILCPKHGDITGTTAGHIACLSNRKGNCKKCGDEHASKTRTKEEDYFINTFMTTGIFEDGTTFKFLGYKEGCTRRLWEVYCSRCEEIFISTSASLQAGKVTCSCSSEHQKQAYINKIMLDGELIGLKFGVSKNAQSRNSSINRTTGYDIVLDCVYEFDTASTCRKAEASCKTELDCGVFSKNEMPDGFTETTHTFNYEAIKSIYEKFGGRLLTNSC